MANSYTIIAVIACREFVRLASGEGTGYGCISFMRGRIALIQAGRLWEGRCLMRIATIAGVLCMAGALGGCGMVGSWFGGGGPGRSVEFVSSNPDSILLDFSAKPPGELAAATDTATKQCHMFHRGDAALESLNVRTEGTIRATYLCGK